MGKSYVLRYIIEQLRLKHPGYGAVAVTASTGIAAQHISGVTIHSFAGIGLGKNNKETLLAKLSQESRQRWERCSVLIVDEISMVDSQLLDKLDYVARGVRSHSSHASFGGIRLVLSGDFFQLPPVGLGNFGSQFAFASRAWAAARVRKLVLSRASKGPHLYGFIA